MKKLIKKIIDKNGFTVYKNNALPVGTDYRKTIRNLFDINTIKTIFDVGANKGQFCIHCAELFENSKIYSFEPILNTFNILKEKTKNISNVRCYHLACGNEIKQEEIFIQDSSVINSLNPVVNIRKNNDQKSELVTIVTVDSFCLENKIEKIDILKIDTEGFDKNVLAGATTMLSEKRISFIFIEVTFDQDNNHNSSYKSISEYLDPFNFKIHGFYNQSIHEGSTKMNYCDALFYLQP